MESLGQKLRITREEKGIDLEQAARETNITRRYLEAPEAEDFSIFPGEPYLIGFLRNYSDYLGINSADMTTAYRNMRIQEQPVPINELVPRRPFPVIPVAIASAAVVLLVIISIFVIPRFGDGKKAVVEKDEMKHQSTDYILGAEGISRRLYVGDTVSVPIGGQTYTLAVSATGPSFSLDTLQGTQVIDLGEEASLDVDGVVGGDIIVSVTELSKSDPSRGAEVHISFSSAVPGLTAADTQTIPSVSSVSQVTASGARITSIKEFEGNRAYPISVNVTFRGSCIFRYESDGKTRVEDYYESGDSLVIQANNGIRLWSSNANAAKIQVIGGGHSAELELGRPGQVMVQDIKWLKDDEPGKFKLAVIEVD